MIGQDPAQGAAVDTTIERLAGPTRYETAVAIAEAYVEDRRGSTAPVASAILTSGIDQHFGYAVTAPALSRLHRAPLLLSGPDQLPDSVASFLRSNQIRTVYILGGTDIVSQEVAEAVRALGGIRVTRIAGDDAYTTAVAVAGLVGPRAGQPGEFRTQGRTALVATGEVFADALAAGPLAYRGEHPVLLTPRGSLHADVSSFLTRSRTEHVVILGGTAAVSAEVENAIRALNISVDRLWGSDRFLTAVQIAEELLGGGSTPVPCFDGGRLGLAYGRKAADALVSGSLLGELCAPLLLTERDSLPDSVERFLESDRYETGDADGDLRITVFGGQLAVSADAISQAESAATLVPVRARITGVEGRCHFAVTFDEPVLASDASNARYYRLAGSTLDPRDVDVDAGSGTTTRNVTVVLEDAYQPADAAVPVGCSTHAALQAREDIEVVGGVIEAATGRRTVGRTAVTVSTDRSRPRLTAIALDGADFVWVESNEPLRLGTGSVDFRRAGSPGLTATAEFDVELGALEFEVEVPSEFGGLEAGDRVTVTEGAVRDLVKRENQQITVTARRDSTAPRVGSVTVSEPQGRRAASISVDAREGGSLERGGFTISAKQGGAAYGAAGNDWTLRIDRELAWASYRRSLVNVVPGGKRIELRVAHSRTLDDLVDDLYDDAGFESLFEATVDPDIDARRAVIDRDVVTSVLDGGHSTVDLTVTWTEPVVDCNPGEIELDIDGDGDYDLYLDGYDIDDRNVEFVDALDGNPAIVAGRADCDTAPGVRDGTMVARLQSDDITALPSLRSRLYTHVAAATDLAGNESVSRRFSSFSRP